MGLNVCICLIIQSAALLSASVPFYPKIPRHTEMNSVSSIISFLNCLKILNMLHDFSWRICVLINDSHYGPPLGKGCFVSTTSMSEARNYCLCALHLASFVACLNYEFGILFIFLAWQEESLNPNLYKFYKLLCTLFLIFFSIPFEYSHFTVKTDLILYSPPIFMLSTALSVIYY